MARGRMINRKVATSQKVAELGEDAGPWAVVFQHRIIAFLDKNGNVRADPYWLKAEVMPRVSGVDPEDCRKLAAALVEHGLAVPYEIDGMPYLHFPGFRGEQVGLRVDRESADVPVPQGFDEASGEFPDGLRQASGSAPAQARGREHGAVRGREVEGEVEVEGEGTTTSDKSLGAGAPQSDNLGSVLAPLIREHMWLGKEPPPKTLEREPGWNMGREITVARQLIDGGDVTAADLARIIETHRDALEVEGGVPTSLLWFNRKDRRDLLNICRGYLDKHADQASSVGDVLRKLQVSP